MDDLLRDFLTETVEHLDVVEGDLVRLERDPSDQAILRNVFRLLHTIKGTCGFLGLPRLEALTHAAEHLIEQLRDGEPAIPEAVALVLATFDRIKFVLGEIERDRREPPGSDDDVLRAIERAIDAARTSADPQRSRRSGAAIPVRPDDDPTGSRPRTIRVAINTLDHLMTVVSELVLTRNQLLDVARRGEGDDRYGVPLARLSAVTAELQLGVMKARMQPIGTVWSKLPRLVRDLAADLEKSVELVLAGADTELDRQVLEIVRDPLTHMVRNAADHGIEGSTERVARGKTRHGTVRLSARHEGGSIVIEVADDGRGIDLAAVRRRAVDRGLVTQAEVSCMGDETAARFILQPGFSTSSEVSAVSGRGVGMDVVKTNLDLIGGEIEIASRAGEGTTFRLKIPLTLVIMPALIVEVAGQRYALAQSATIELVRVRSAGEHKVDRIRGAAVLRLRGDLLPVVDLASLLGIGAVEPVEHDGYVVVVQAGRHRYGLLVAAALETEEIIVKSMSSVLRHQHLFSGNTILGDGTVVLIVDLNGIARRIAPDLLWAVPDTVAADAREAEAPERATLLVFRGPDRVPKAVPLPLVTRLEEVPATAIEWLGARAFLQYRGGLMPLFPISEGMPLGADRVQPLIVFSDGERRLALAVAEILDIVDCELEIEPVPDRPDLVGSAIVRGRATEIVDLGAYLPRHPEGWSGPRHDERRPVILLAEESSFFREMLTPILKAAGYRVRTASSGKQALAMLRAESMQVLVADAGLFEEHEPAMSSATTGLTTILLSSDGTIASAMPPEDGRISATVAKFDRSGLLAALSSEGRPARQQAA